MIGDPVCGNDFFDRERIINELVELANSKKSFKIALVGLRKIGKTSIIYELKNRVKNPICLIYVGKEDLHSFLRKYVRIVLSSFLESKGRDAEPLKDFDTVISETIELVPKHTKFLYSLRDVTKKPKEFLPDIFDLPELLLEKPNQIIVCFDEFQRMADLGLIDTLREKIMFHKQTSYIFTGSAIGMVNNILLSPKSPLFGHFEVRRVEPFSYNVSRRFILKKLKQPIPESILNFLIGVSGGIPFYLDVLTDRISKNAKSLKGINQKIVVESIAEELFNSTGRIYSVLNYTVETSLDKRGLGRYITIMEAIAYENHRISEIARHVDLPPQNLTKPMRRLIEVGFVAKTENKYVLIDPMLEFWLRDVWTLRDRTSDIKLALDSFKSQVSQMIKEFKDELGHAREAQIREIFIEGGYDVSSGNLEGGEFDLIIKTKRGLVLGEVKTGNVDLISVNNFLRKGQKVQKNHHVERMILFALLGVDEKAKWVCIENNVEIWDLKKINEERRKLNLVKLNV